MLTNGLLQRLRLVLDGRAGLTVQPAWNAPINLGSPLYPSQVEPNVATGHGTIFLTTQGNSPQAALATALDDDTGEIHWQRQLGLVCNGEPLLLHAPEEKGPPLLLALDQSGRLFAFDPLLIDPKPGELRESHGRRLAPALEPNPHATPLLLRGDGESAFEIACPGDGKELIVRHVTVGENRQLQWRGGRVKLEANLIGTPGPSGAASQPRFCCWPTAACTACCGSKPTSLWKWSMNGA